ncbi:MAG: DUF1203 domain-containing protein [Hyphomicrobiales bacterium]|nr:DUF1203 domain-containing protein [Hyphomicrobiales bacterium]
MTALRFIALPTDTARALRAGGPDANGQAPVRRVSDGAGIPCRHCLAPVAAGDPYLVLAHRPFPAAQPYAETGPVFLHAGDCPRHGEDAGMPPMFRARETWLLRGYGADDWIVYGTGGPVPTRDLEARAADLLARPDVAYLHLRSAQYNCFQCRIEEG